MAIGSAIGGVAGGIIGAIPTLGFGAPAGAAAGSALGGLIEGGVRWGQANKQQLPTTDYRTTNLYNQIRDMRSRMEAGTMYSPQMEAIQQQGTMMTNRMTRAAGGNIGALLSGYGQVQRGVGRSLNEMYSQMFGQSAQMLPLQAELANRMYMPRWHEGWYNKQQAMGNSAKIMQDAMANAMAFAARQKSGTGTAVDEFLGMGGDSFETPQAQQTPTSPLLQQYYPSYIGNNQQQQPVGWGGIPYQQPSPLY